MKKFIFLIIGWSSIGGLCAQSYAFGFKGGLTIGTQKWNNYEREALFSWNGHVFIESLPEESNFVLYGQLGYHNKGSAIISQAFFDPVSGIDFERRRFDYVFKNISLILGGKNRYPISESTVGYYMLGIRGDFNLGTNTDLFEGFEQFINKFTYGATLGGGIEFPIADRVGLILEFQVSPDFSRQILVPQGQYRNAVTNQLVTVQQQEVRNTAFEVTVGLRLERIIEYID